MIQATLSFMGLYKANPHLLDNLHLPAQIDAEELKKRLLVETAGLEVLYPDAGFMAEALENYSALRLHAWEEMAKVLMRENYDPFTNVSRHEERTETETRDLTSTLQGTNTGRVSAYNLVSFTDKDQNLTDSTGKDSGTITKTMSYDLKGDSAISDTQDLIKKEIKLRSQFSLFSIIISDIKQNFCLGVY